MDNKYVTDRIDEFTKLNKEYTRKFNELLNGIRGEINKEVAAFELAEKESHDQAYNQGVMDLWEAVYAIAVDPTYGGLSTDECFKIFGHRYTTDICLNRTGFEVLNRYKKYKETKEEKERQEKEAATFEKGDVIACDAIGGEFKAILIEETEDYYMVLGDGNDYTSRLEKDVFPIRKTGKHIDLSLD